MRKFLLIQFDPDSFKKPSHERDCFSRFFPLISLNVFFDDLNSPQKILKDKKGVILGGSSFCLASSKKEEREKVERIIKKIKKLILFLFEKDFPTLGICFGHQLLGYFLGSRVIYDRNQNGVGSYKVYLTKEGKNDPLFDKINSPFIAHFAHKNVVESLPKGAVLLAKTKRCKITAFRFKKNIYGVQFHPELSKKDMIFRLRKYPDYWFGKSFSQIKIKIKTSFSAKKILKNFKKIAEKK